MKDNERKCFQIISNVGTARSCFVEAIQEAKANNFEQAEKLIKEGDEANISAHRIHFEMIQTEAKREELDLNLLLIHAEDQLMTTETLKIMAEELIDLYKKLNNCN